MKTLRLQREKPRYWFIKSLAILFIIFTTDFNAECQKSDAPLSTFKGGSYENTFSTSRIGVAQSVMTTPEKELHIVIQHRFGDISAGAYEFFGLDGAVTRFGIDYGILDWLSAGIGRSLIEKTFDLELKASILKQNETNIPVSVSYYISASEITQRNYFPAGHDSFGSRLSFANQIMVARNQGIFSFQVSPLWLHSNFEIRTGSALNLFAIDLDGRIRLTEMIGLIGEYIPILTKESFTNTNPLTIGLDINTGGHQFQLIFSNSYGLNEKTITTNTTGKWSKGHIYFGFNLTRVFDFKKS